MAIPHLKTDVVVLLRYQFITEFFNLSSTFNGIFKRTGQIEKFGNKLIPH